ncbi:MAG: serine protease [bacterium]|nr:serine protease [bacterium]
MKEKIITVIAIFVIGLAGGLLGRVLWPHIGGDLAEQGPVFLSETKQVYIQENVALVGAVERAERAVVAIKAQLPAGKLLEGSGLVVTSDGLMVTLAELVPFGSGFDFFVEGERVSYQILKRDLNENLALVKLSKSGLTTAGFAALDKLKMGERVFLIGTVFGEEDKSSSSPFIATRVVNEGIVRAFDGDSIQTSIIEGYSISGSPLFNIKGEILGINTVGLSGRISAIPVSKIREFVGI